MKILNFPVGEHISKSMYQLEIIHSFASDLSGHVTPSPHFSNLTKGGRKCASRPPISHLSPLQRHPPTDVRRCPSTPPSSEASHPRSLLSSPNIPVKKEKTTVYRLKHAYLTVFFLFLNCHFNGCTEPNLSVYNI